MLNWHDLYANSPLCAVVYIPVLLTQQARIQRGGDGGDHPPPPNGQNFLDFVYLYTKKKANFNMKSPPPKSASGSAPAQ